MGDWGGSWGQAYVSKQAGGQAQNAAQVAENYIYSHINEADNLLSPAYQAATTGLGQGLAPGGKFNAPFQYDPSNPESMAIQQAIASGGAATGQTYSGNQLAAAANAQGGDYAQQYNMFETDLNRQYNEMFGMAQLGTNTMMGSASTGALAGNFGVNSALYGGAGNIGAASALNQGTTNAFNSWGGIAGLIKSWQTPDTPDGTDDDDE